MKNLATRYKIKLPTNLINYEDTSTQKSNMLIYLTSETHKRFSVYFTFFSENLLVQDQEQNLF